MSNRPTEYDIKYLQENPEMAEKFDAQFGAGAAVSVLGPVTQSPDPQPSPEVPDQDTQEVPQEDEPGLLVEIGQGLAHGVQEAANETVDALEAFDIAASKKLDEWGIPSRLQIVNQDGEFDPKLKTYAESVGDTDWLGGQTTVKGDALEIGVVKKPVSEIGKFASTTSQFLAGFLGAKKVTGLKGVVGAYLNGAVADAVVFDPSDENLSAFMNENGWAIPGLTEALATDPDAPEWENRVRNAIEGGVAGAVLDNTLRGFKAIAKASKARLTGDKALATEAAELADEVAQVAQDHLDTGVPVKEAVEETAEDAVQDAAEDAVARQWVDEDALKTALADRDFITPEQLEETLWFNPSKGAAQADAGKVIEIAGDALARSGALERMGLDKPETFKKLATDVGDLLGDNKWVGEVLEASKAAPDMAKRLLAGHSAIQSFGREISRKITALDGLYAQGTTDVKLEAEVLDLLTTHANLQAEVKNIQTGVARALNAGRLARKDALSGEEVQSAMARIEAAGGSKAVKKAVQQLRHATNPMAQAKLVRAMTREGRLTKTVRIANEVYINSILSGWATHAVNMSVNAFQTLYLPLERGLGAALTGSKDEVAKAAHQYAAMRSSVLDASRLAAKVLRTEQPILDTAVKLDHAAEGFHAITKEQVGAQSAFGGALVDGVGKFIRIPGRMLMTEDEFFKQITFRSRLTANLTVAAKNLTEADLERLGYKSVGEFITQETEKATWTVQSLHDRFDDLVQAGKMLDDKELRERFIVENTGAANEGSKYGADALRAAREATFTTPLRGGTGSWLLDMSADWQRMANRHPYLRQITPFVQTPANILSKALDRIPGVNLLRENYRARLANPDPAIRSEAAGEMATGVAITASLYFLAMEGRITGGGPRDAGLRDRWMADKNWQPYSINIGTQEEPNWLDVSRFDPFALPFGVIGDLVEMQEAAEKDPAVDTAGLFASAAVSVLNNITSKVWLQSVADFIEITQSKDRPWIMQRFLENRAAAFVPFSSAFKAYNEFGEDFQREARGYVDKIKLRVPGMSEEVPIRHDWLTGEAMDAPSKILGYIKYKDGEQDPVAAEFRRLGYGFTGPDRKIGPIKLSTEQYQDWRRLMGTTRIAGRTLHEELEKAINTPEYDKARERNPDGVTRPVESHRVKMLRPIITAYKQKARDELMGLYPELDKAVFEYDVFRHRAAAGEVTTDERKNLITGF